MKKMILILVLIALLIGCSGPSYTGTIIEKFHDPTGHYLKLQNDKGMTVITVTANIYYLVEESWTCKFSKSSNAPFKGPLDRMDCNLGVDEEE